MASYVYIIIRTDIDLADQLVQVGHAALECGQYLAGKPLESHNLVLLAVPDETSLRAELERLTEAHGVACILIREPDLGNTATALATEPLDGPRRRCLCALPLWPGRSATYSFTHYAEVA